MDKSTVSIDNIFYVNQGKIRLVITENIFEAESIVAYVNDNYRHMSTIILSNVSISIYMKRTTIACYRSGKSTSVYSDDTGNIISIGKDHEFKCNYCSQRASDTHNTIIDGSYLRDTIAKYVVIFGHCQMLNSTNREVNILSSSESIIDILDKVKIYEINAENCNFTNEQDIRMYIMKNINDGHHRTIDQIHKMINSAINSALVNPNIIENILDRIHPIIPNND